MKNFKVYVTNDKNYNNSLETYDYENWTVNVEAENIPCAVDIAEGRIGVGDKIYGVMENKNNEYKKYDVCVNINRGYYYFTVKAINFRDALKEAEDRIKDGDVIESITEVK